jgi:hypothetical protein
VPYQGADAESHEWNPDDGNGIVEPWSFVEDLGLDDGSSSLHGVDTRTGATQKVGETGRYFLTDITFTPNGDQFAVSMPTSPFDDSLLVLLNRDGASEITRWRLPRGLELNALASDRTGQLWLSGLDGVLYRINTAITKIRRIGPFGQGFYSSGDLAFHQNGKRLYATAPFNQQTDVLLRVFKNDGAAAEIGVIGYPAVYGLSFGPDGELYGIARGEGPDPLVLRIRTRPRRNSRGGADPSKPLGRAVSRTNLPSVGGMAARQVLSPVRGPLRVTKEDNPLCAWHPTKWTACQHEGPTHGPGTGDGEADDTYAHDFNLANHADYQTPVYAIAPGRVVKYGGEHGLLPDGGKNGSVLVEHTARSTVWYSGYLHMRNIGVGLGDMVTTETQLGTIGAKGLEDYEDCIGKPEHECAHLHFVAYLGENGLDEHGESKLISVDVTFFERR